MRLKNTAQVAPLTQPRDREVGQERSLIEFGWEVHECYDPDEGFRPKHARLNNFHLPPSSICTLQGGEVVPDQAC